MAQVDLYQYLNEIRTLLTNQRYATAAAHCQHILKTYPRHVDTYRLLAKALLSRKAYEEAADLYRRVLSADPNDIAARVGMATIHKVWEELPQAVWQLSRACDLDPYNYNLREKLNGLMGQGRKPKRLDVSQAALGVLHFRSGAYKQAIQTLTAVLAEKPDRLDLKLLLAECYWRLDKKVDAARTAQEILETLPYSIRGNAILADVWLRSGKVASAQKYLHLLQSLTLPAQNSADFDTPEGRAFLTRELREIPRQIGMTYLEEVEVDESLITYDGDDEWNQDELDLVEDATIIADEEPFEEEVEVDFLALLDSANADIFTMAAEEEVDDYEYEPTDIAPLSDEATAEAEAQDSWLADLEVRDDTLPTYEEDDDFELPPAEYETDESMAEAPSWLSEMDTGSLAGKGKMPDWMGQADEDDDLRDEKRPDWFEEEEEEEDFLSGLMMSRDELATLGQQDTLMDVADEDEDEFDFLSALKESDDRREEDASAEAFAGTANEDPLDFLDKLGGESGTADDATVEMPSMFDVGDAADDDFSFLDEDEDQNEGESLDFLEEAESNTAVANDDVPDWLSEFADTTPVDENDLADLLDDGSSGIDPFAGEGDDWLPSAEEVEEGFSDDMPAWMQEAAAEPNGNFDVDDWFTDESDMSDSGTPSTQTDDVDEGLSLDTDWLSEMGVEATINAGEDLGASADEDEGDEWLADIDLGDPTAVAEESDNTENSRESLNLNTGWLRDIGVMGEESSTTINEGDDAETDDDEAWLAGLELETADENESLDEPEMASQEGLNLNTGWLRDIGVVEEEASSTNEQEEGNELQLKADGQDEDEPAVDESEQEGLDWLSATDTPTAEESDDDWLADSDSSERNDGGLDWLSATDTPTADKSDDDWLTNSDLPENDDGGLDWLSATDTPTAEESDDDWLADSDSSERDDGGLDWLSATDTPTAEESNDDWLTDSDSSERDDGGLDWLSATDTPTAEESDDDWLTDSDLPENDDGGLDWLSDIDNLAEEQDEEADEDLRLDTNWLSANEMEEPEGDEDWSRDIALDEETAEGELENFAFSLMDDQQEGSAEPVDADEADLMDFAFSNDAPAEEAVAETILESEIPSWLDALKGEEITDNSEDEPDWLSAVDTLSANDVGDALSDDWLSDVADIDNSEDEPDWLSAVDTPSADEALGDDWLSDVADIDNSEDEPDWLSAVDTPSADEALGDDWLSDVAGIDNSENEPDWLSAVDTPSADEANDALGDAADASDPLPDWLTTPEDVNDTKRDRSTDWLPHEMLAEERSDSAVDTETITEDALPNWLADMPSQTGQEVSAGTDWLAQSKEWEEDNDAEEETLPEWLTNTPDTLINMPPITEEMISSYESDAAEELDGDGAEEEKDALPDWLQTTAGSETHAYETDLDAEFLSYEEPEADEEDLPDWLSENDSSAEPTADQQSDLAMAGDFLNDIPAETETVDINEPDEPTEATAQLEELDDFAAQLAFLEAQAAQQEDTLGEEGLLTPQEIDIPTSLVDETAQLLEEVEEETSIGSDEEIDLNWLSAVDSDDELEVADGRGDAELDWLNTATEAPAEDEGSDGFDWLSSSVENDTETEDIPAELDWLDTAVEVSDEDGDINADNLDWFSNDAEEPDWLANAEEADFDETFDEAEMNWLQTEEEVPADPIAETEAESNSGNLQMDEEYLEETLSWLEKIALSDDE